MPLTGPVEPKMPSIDSIRERIALLNMSPQECLDLARIALEFPRGTEDMAADPDSRFREATDWLVREEIRRNIRGDHQGLLHTDCILETVIQLDVARRKCTKEKPDIKDAEALDLATSHLFEQITAS